ncbi:hypothetical protein PEC18_19310 [Paucibacter sp. O1-1]|nr:hypothetical protein [Paucibacter sp. O1-1]MDA3827936.1 hypothetical protein [Paucibacter sp. O1-1]
MLPITELAYQVDGVRDTRLFVIVAESADYLVVRGSEVHRRGGAYQRIAVRNVLSRTEPANAISILLRDGRELVGRGDDAAIRALPETRSLRIDDGGTAFDIAGRDIVEVLAPNRLGVVARWRVSPGASPHSCPAVAWRCTPTACFRRLSARSCW